MISRYFQMKSRYWNLHKTYCEELTMRTIVCSLIDGNVWKPCNLMMMSIPYEASKTQSVWNVFSCFALRLLYLLYIMSIHLIIIRHITRIESMLDPGLVINDFRSCILNIRHSNKIAFYSIQPAIHLIISIYLWKISRMPASSFKRF